MGTDSGLPLDPNFHKTLLDRVSDGVYFVDTERRILFWNEGAYRLTGYKAEEAVGRCCPEGVLCHINDAGDGLCTENCPLSGALRDGKKREVCVILRHKSGHRVPVTARVEPIRGVDGSIVGAVQIFTDDSVHQDARRKVQDMERLAFFDHITELPNRRFLEMSLQTALSEYHLHKDPFGVLLMDLDQLKPINDRFGHAAGDRALRAVAMTLVGALRPTDIVGRWGGDEFVAIVHHVNSDILQNLAERCRTMIANTSFPTSEGEPMSLSVSIGQTLVRSPDTAEAVVKRADELMYQNKTRNSAFARNNALGRGTAVVRAWDALKASSTRLLSLSRIFSSREQ